MKRLISSLTLLFISATLLTTVANSAIAFKDEALRYVISYKWGLVHKDAGEATLSLKNSGDYYKVKLSAKTKPWADRVYSVRDTLYGTIKRNGLIPVKYIKSTHEKGVYKRDEVAFSKSDNTTIGHTKQYRPQEDGSMSCKEQTLKGTGPVYDMLSVFYYLRSLDYDALNKNKVYTATVFSGKKSEKITIKSVGVEKIKLKDNTTRDAYHIRFNFTQEGGKKSSDDINTWISKDSDHIPLYVVGKLPIGEVRAYFLGK